MANNPEIKIVITGDSSKATQSIKALEKELKKIENIKVSSNLGESFKKIGESTNNIKSASSAVNNLKGNFDKLGLSLKSIAADKIKLISSAVNNLKGNFDKLGLSLKSAVAAYVGFQAISTLVSKGIQTFTSFLKTGFDAVNDFELTIVSLAATMATFNKESTPENIVEQYVEFKDKAKAIIPVLDQLASKTLLSGDNVRTMVLEFTKGGQQIDSTNKRQISAITNIANALGVILGDQLNRKQVMQEIGDLWQGQITAASSLGQVLKGVIGKNIKEQLGIWKDQGILIEKVGETLGAFGAASEDLKNSWAAVKSTIETTLTTLLRTEFAPINEVIISRVKEFNELLKENPEVVKNIINNLKDMASLLSTISSIVGTVTIALDKMKVITEFSLRVIRKTVKETDSFIKSLDKGLDKLNEERQKRQVKVFDSENIKQVEKIKTDIKIIAEIEGKRVSITKKQLEFFKKQGIEVKQVEGTLQRQIVDYGLIGKKTQEILDKIGNISDAEKKVKKEIEGLIKKYDDLSEAADLKKATEGLNTHEAKIVEIKRELSKSIEKYGVIPKLITAATEAINKEKIAAQELNVELAKTATLAAQRTISGSEFASKQERVKAIEAIKNAEIAQAEEITRKRIEEGAKRSIAERALELEKLKIIKESQAEILEIQNSASTQLVAITNSQIDEQLKSHESFNTTIVLKDGVYKTVASNNVEQVTEKRKEELSNQKNDHSAFIDRLIAQENNLKNTQISNTEQVNKTRTAQIGNFFDDMSNFFTQIKNGFINQAKENTNAAKQELENQKDDYGRFIESIITKDGVLTNKLISNDEKVTSNVLDNLNERKNAAVSVFGETNQAISTSTEFLTKNLEEYKEFLSEIGRPVVGISGVISNELPKTFEQVRDAIRESAFASEKLAANMEETAKATAKAKKFGEALTVDLVSSLALERNLRAAGRGGFASRSVESLALSGEGIRSIVPESFQQESRMLAIQDVLSRAATGQETGFSGEQIQGLRDELQQKFGINFRGRGNTDNSINTSNVYNISTPDVQSFRSSQKQISEESNRQSEQVARRQRRGIVGGLR